MKILTKLIIATGFLVSLTSCTDPNQNENHFFSLYYSFTTFPDYDKTGVYLLDTRLLYQNILYRFDFSSEQWTIEDDCNDLVKRYSLEITDAFSVSPDTLIAISNNGEVFSYNLTSKHWNLENSQAHVFNFGEDLSFYHPYIYNNFNKKVFYIRTKTNGTSMEDLADIYILENNSTWKKVCSVNGYFLFETAYFRDKENIRMINKQRSFDNYSLSTDSIFIVNVNVTTGKCVTDTSIEFKKDKLSYVSGIVENDFISTNQEFYMYSELYSEGQSKLLISKIPDNQTDFQTDTLIKTEWESNNQNPNRMDQVKYIGKARKNMYVFNHNYYLFISEFPYKYSPGTKQWTALQPCPFKTLNKK